MTYKVDYTDSGVYLKRPDGSTITELSEPVTVPNDIIDPILDDANFGSPQKEALKAAFGSVDIDRS